ncbi:MAG: Crp/Fnr family transcriptional regulator [Bdellovibrionales bacterium]|jgi:CRP-like cAMP-binding protein|nr:Crp/Fnr family transcriptional regulator [Bdellovibrionales bacterium]
MSLTSAQKTLIQTHLRAQPLFKPLRDDVLAGFSEYAVMRLEKKGTVLFPADTPNEKIYLVLSGWVKLFRETLAGDEAVVDVLTTGNFFGEFGLSGHDVMPYGAEVVEDAEVIAIPRFLIVEEIMRNSLFGMSVLQNMTNQRLQRDMEIEHRTVQSAPQRIGCFLLKFCRSHTAGPVVLHLPYDKTVVAHRLGMQPETFSRALGKLRDETGLRVRGATVEIDDVRRLVDYTCSACSSSFPCAE